MMSEKKVPAIRFRGFEDDWEQRKLSDIYKDIGNAFVGTATPYYVEEGHFYLESNNIKDGLINHNTEVFINDVFYENQKDKWLHTGDMVMVQSGHVGHAAVIPKELDCSAAHALIMFRNPKVEIEPYFLNYQYQTAKSKKKIENITTGNTIKHILASEMQEFIVDVTSYGEQKKIAGFFRDLDNLITLHQCKLEKLKIVKKSMLVNCFPKNGEKVPKFRFSGFTGDWEQRKLSDLVDVCSGMDYKHLSIGNIPVFGTGGYMLSVDKALSYDRDAIGIGRKGTIDKPYILKAPFWTVDTLFYCIPRDEGTLNFDYDLFQCIDWKQKDESTGVPSLSKVAINDTDVIVPKTEEQKKIGYFFEELDLVITLHQKQWFILKKLQFSPGSNSPVAA